MRHTVLIPALLLTACGQGEQTTRIKDSEGNDRSITVKDDGGTRTVTSGDGLIRAEGTQGGANARFPAFAPQYPGAKVQAAVDLDSGTAQTGGVKMHMITMMTSDSPEAVIAFYKDKASATGKRIQEMKSATGPMLSISGKSLTDVEVNVTAMPTGTGTSVNVSVQEKFSPG